MSLARGIGPLARPAAGEGNAAIDGPARLLWFHDLPQRVRATVAGEVVVDTIGARLLHETGLLPVCYVPRADVRGDLLEPSDRRSHCPYKGEARYWHLRVGDVLVPDAAWGYDDPIPGCPDLAPYLAFYRERLEHWYDEDVEVHGHPRDPFHRVDVRPSSRAVVVRLDGAVVARWEHPVLLFETGLPVRAYLPERAWRTELFVASDRTTVCPYKGTAEHRSLRSPTSGEVVGDVLWRYAEPLDEARGVAGLWCADQDHDRVEVDLARGGGAPPGGRA